MSKNVRQILAKNINLYNKLGQKKKLATNFLIYF